MPEPASGREIEVSSVATMPNLRYQPNPQRSSRLIEASKTIKLHVIVGDGNCFFRALNPRDDLLPIKHVRDIRSTKISKLHQPPQTLEAHEM